MSEPLQLEDLKTNHPLSSLCTFGIGGPARYYYEARTIQAMQSVIRLCKEKKLPYLVIGKGSNCLFDDAGFNGVVIGNKIDFMENPAPGVFYVGAGYSFSLLGVQTARQEWSGLEFASGIPASVGGAVFMNAGANGSETCEALTSVDFVTDAGELVRFDKENLRFSYRHSCFQTMRGAIVAATFTLTPSKDARPKQIDIIQYRKKTQPYGDKSAGCVFRNPVTGHAGALIDQAGLKGTRVGGAEVSDMHANFIVNRQGATSKDVLALIRLIQHRVRETAGLELESEVRLIPSDVEKP